MEALRGDHTVIVVAHRLHTIRDADLIVVLSEDGTVAERGTHDELLAKGGRYAESWACRTGSSPGSRSSSSWTTTTTASEKRG